MAKAKKGSKENPITEGPDHKIIQASIKDGFLNYSYEVLKGHNAGFVHSVKGKGIIRDSLQEAFNKFNVHLAVIDEVFKHSQIEIGDIDKYHNHELSTNYTTSSMVLKGDEGAETAQLSGSKYTSLGSIDIKSPAITIDNLSSYQWHNELRAAVTDAVSEVQLYMEGNFDMPEKEERSTSKQLVIGENIDPGFDNEKDFIEAAM